MNSSRPYLLRAIYQWIVDNDCTPYLLVNAVAPGVSVPVEYVENDKIILNIGPTAAHQLVLGDEEIEFNARFGGRPMEVAAPISAVLAIYARENGQGMLFTDDEGESEDSGDPEATDPNTAEGETADSTDESARSRPNLKVIK
jgi:stringent starvation protein B